MDVAGLLLGIAGLFSVCVTVLDKVQSYKSSEHESHQLVTRFEAEKFRLYEWAKLVGIRGGVLLEEHHSRLDDLAVRSIVYQIICSIIELFPRTEKTLIHLGHVKPIDQAQLTGQTAIESSVSTHSIGRLSQKSRIKWMFGNEVKFTRQIETFEVLIDKLYALVPLELSIEAEDRPSIGQKNDITQGLQLLDNLHQGLQSLLESHDRKVAADQRELFQTMIRSPLVTDDLSENLLKRLEGTCDWIFTQPAFTEWKAYNTADPTTTQFLWLYGPAGTGKSVLAAQIVSWLRKLPDIHCFHFFCSSHVQSGGTLDGSIRSWVCQMIRLDRVTLDLEMELVHWNNDTQISTQTIWNIFSKVAGQLSNCFFVIDGLDEYSKVKDSRQKFLVTLKQTLASTGSRVLITSRDELDLRAELVKQESTEAGVLLTHHKITKFDTEADIGVFSRSMVNQRLSKKDPQFQKELADTLRQRCEGMFLWISLSGQNIRGGLSNARILQTIERAPDGLASAYARSWERILGQSSYERSRAIQILSWCCFGFRPLTVGELTEALIVSASRAKEFNISDMPDETDAEFVNEEIIDLCNSLVETGSGQQSESISQQTIQLVHFSVKDFLLTAPNPYYAKQFELTEEHHLELAKVCLQYLNSFQNISLVGTHEGLFMKYAVQNWHVHRQKSGPSDTLLSQLAAVFLDYKGRGFSDWLDAYRKFTSFEERLPQTEIGTKEAAVYLAASLNLPQTIEILYAKGNVDINAIAGFFGTPLQAACAYGDKQTIEQLISLGSSVNNSGGAWGNALHVAAGFNRLELAEELLRKGLGLDTRNSNNVTPLMLACHRGHVDMVRYLVDKNADLNAKNVTGWTSLHFAAVYGYESIARILLAAGANCDVLFDSKCTPLNVAVDQVHTSVVIIILEATRPPSVAVAGSPVSCMVSLSTIENVGLPRTNLLATEGHAEAIALPSKASDHIACIDYPDEAGYTPLNNAAWGGSIEVVRLLLAAGADPTLANNTRHQPIHSAAGNGYITIVEELLKQDPKLAYATSLDGNTPFTLSASRGHIEIVQLFLRLTPELIDKPSEENNPLQQAVIAGHQEIAALLLDHGAANINMDHGLSNVFCLQNSVEMMKTLLLHGSSDVLSVSSSSEFLPLQFATSRNNLEMAQFLIDHGADVNATKRDGAAPLLLAIMYGFTEMVRLLIANGCDVLGDEGGQRPLALAVIFDYTEIIKLLVDVGAVTDVHSKSDGTALTTAARYGLFSCIRLLVGQGADINQATTSGETPLYIAVITGNVDIVLYLISQNANLTLSNHYGESLLHVAAHGGHREIVELLFDHLRAERQSIEVPDSVSNETRICAEECDDDGRTVLHHAAISGSVPVMEYLYTLGYDLAAFDKRGRTILEYACLSGSLEMVNWVLRHGRRSDSNLVSSQPSSKWSTLHWACRKGDVAILQILSNAGYTSSITPTDIPAVSWSPFDIARYFDNQDIMGTSQEGWGQLLRSGMVVKDSSVEGGYVTVSANDLPPSKKKEDARCDGCFMNIYGVYFHCQKCPDFDYCFMCKADSGDAHNLEHTWECIEPAIAQT